MNKRNILGAALAGTAALVALSSNASATAGDTATISGGQSWNICVSTQTPYSGSRFTADITKAGFESQIVYDNFNGEACKTVKLDTGSYSVKLNTPMNTGNVSYAIGGVYNDTLTFSIGSVDNKYYNIYGALDYSADASAVAVHFDANGGTGTMASQQYAINTQVTLPSNTFTNGSSSFDGWNTAADGSGTAYADGATPTFTTAGEITLYAQWVAGFDPCSSDVLYHTIQCIAQTRNANDANLDFSADIDPNVSAQNGVFILDEKKNEQYPVYYYRGHATNQHLVWAGKCWNIYRTTETGGTKIVYYGEAINNNGTYTCGSDPDDYLDTVNESDTYMAIPGNVPSFTTSPALGGYMYGDYTPDFSFALINPSDTYSFSETVSYSNGTYTLSGDIVTGTYNDYISAAEADHHYYCPNGTTSCSDVKYYMDWETYQSSIGIYSLDLGGYANIEAAKTAMFTNTSDSSAKSMIDQWYDNNLLSKASDLEDTPFCNDRQFTSGTLAGESSPVNNLTTSGSFPQYATSFFAGSRVYDQFITSSYRPTLSCDNTRDTFTVSNTIGNGKLTRPIALPTADENLMAGFSFNTYYGDTDDQVMLYGYTMTPLMSTHADWNSAGGGTYMGYGSTTATTFDNPLRPMVSLKYGVEITSGTGSKTDPYIIQ